MMWFKYALLYIGKSNKHFTNGRVYDYQASTVSFENSNHFYVKTNQGGKKHFTPEHKEYIDKNFRFIGDEEYKQIIRKNKLTKIDKNEKS